MALGVPSVADNVPPDVAKLVSVKLSASCPDPDIPATVPAKLDDGSSCSSSPALLPVIVFEGEPSAAAIIDALKSDVEVQTPFEAKPTMSALISPFVMFASARG